LSEGRGGLDVAAGDGVGVLVQGGRDASVVEAAGHDHDRDAGVEHLGGHEMTEVVQSERAEPGVPPVAEERLGDPVRLPGGGTTIVAEHEPIPPYANLPSMVGEYLAGGRVKI